MQLIRVSRNSDKNLLLQNNENKPGVCHLTVLLSTVKLRHSDVGHCLLSLLIIHVISCSESSEVNLSHFGNCDKQSTSVSVQSREVLTWGKLFVDANQAIRVNE